MIKVRNNSETGVACTGVCTRQVLFAYIIVSNLLFLGDSWVRKQVGLCVLYLLLGLFLSVCFVWLWYASFVLSYLFYFITFYYCPLAAGFLMTNRKGVNSNGKCDGKNLGRIVGREIVIRIHCVRKKLCSMKKIKEWENTKFDS